MKKHCPDTLTFTESRVKQSRASKGEDFSQLELDGQAFKHVTDDSIDYALIEKSGQVAVVTCDIGWRDMGSLLA